MYVKCMHSALQCLCVSVMCGNAILVVDLALAASSLKYCVTNMMLSRNCVNLSHVLASEKARYNPMRLPCGTICWETAAMDVPGVEIVASVSLQGQLRI